MIAALILMALPQVDLGDLLESLASNPNVRYAAKDDRGNGLDCLKIAQVAPERFVGVSHWQRGGVFSLNLATSTNALDWRFAKELDTHAHQGTLKEVDGKWLLAYEKDGANGNWIRLRAYDSSTDLLAGKHSWEYDLQRSLSEHAEGTPNIEGAEWVDGHWNVDLSFHFLRDDGVDRQALGELMDGQWTTVEDEDLNLRAEELGVEGNLGDRDDFVVEEHRYQIIEAQFERGGWASWRVFLHGFDDVELNLLNFRTKGGSTAFANPSVSNVTLADGEPALALTLFVPSEGAAKGEAGCLIALIPLR